MLPDPHPATATATFAAPTAPPGAPPPPPKHVMLLALGSSGDVHPFMGLGLALQRRGHRVTLATNDHFQALVERAGLTFASLGTTAEYASATNNPDVWHPRRGMQAIMDSGIGDVAARTYDLLASQYVPGCTVAAGTVLAVGGRIAQDKLGLPYASVGFAPTVVRSLIDVPVHPALPITSASPRWLKRLMYALADTLVLDRTLGPHINPLRRQLGLAPVRGIVRQWWFSPQLNICMWPATFAAPQADWPGNSVLTGFPLYDESGTTPLPDAVRAFLHAPGGPPIVFTPGSAMRFGQPFFAAAVGACQALGRRGLLLTRYPEQLPAHLPPGLLHADYAPFSQLLPHVSALVHHGGIGTTAQALSAGVPQLIMPMAHDQFDNAARVQRLGAGEALAREKFNAPRLAARLKALLASTDVTSACAAVARQQAGAPDGCEAAALQIERL